MKLLEDPESKFMNLLCLSSGTEIVEDQDHVQEMDTTMKIHGLRLTGKYIYRISSRIFNDGILRDKNNYDRRNRDRDRDRR